MYDSIACHMNGPPGEQQYLQTKCLGSTYDFYEIREDGTLWLMDERLEGGCARVVEPGTDEIIMTWLNLKDKSIVIYVADFKDGVVTRVYFRDEKEAN